MYKEMPKKALPSENLTPNEGRAQIERENLISFMESIATLPQNAIIKFTIDNQTQVLQTSGRYGQTLYWLVKYQNQGITALSVCNTAYRLASYVHRLRWHFNINIQTTYEPHKGGRHARYWLKIPISIQAIILPAETGL